MPFIFLQKNGFIRYMCIALDDIVPGETQKKELQIANDSLKTEAYVSSISIWEIRIKIKKGKLDI